VSEAREASEAGDRLLSLYDVALPHVYGYLLARCGQRHVAEDLTAETFLAAVDAVRRDAVPDLTTAWLIGVARHKLADHWRRLAREDVKINVVRGGLQAESIDPWNSELDRVLAEQTLAVLSPLHRLVLTLRYVDDLSVGATAEMIGRSVHGTEALLTRAKASFRRNYPTETPEGGES
jgi:RNA polymerase sigma-70 factor (ECF subfamily)